MEKDWVSVHIALCAKPHLQPWQAGECEGIRRDWKKLEGWKKKRDRERHPVVRERWRWVVLMMRASAPFSEETQPWAPPARPRFCSCFPGLTCNPSVEEYTGCVWTCLPAEGLISASGWGAKVSSGWWEVKWASQSWTESLHLDKWSSSPSTVSRYVPWHLICSLESFPSHTNATNEPLIFLNELL